MAEAPPPDPLVPLDVEIDPEFEPQKRPRSCTWPLPRPESSAGKPESTDTDIIPEEEDDEDETATSMTINASSTLSSTSITGDDQNSPNCIAADINASSLGQENAGSPLSAQSPSTAGSGVSSNGLGSQQPRKSSSRRNAWGNLSYADLITKAIESTPDKRLTLSQIYDWMVRCVPYFKDKGDSNSSAGWKSDDSLPHACNTATVLRNILDRKRDGKWQEEILTAAKIDGYRHGKLECCTSIVSAHESTSVAPLRWGRACHLATHCIMGRLTGPSSCHATTTAGRNKNTNINGGCDNRKVTVAEEDKRQEGKSVDHMTSEGELSEREISRPQT
ncbi:hypothetical protein JZ751_005178 [Albula glossodonta]|uniref:Fork-head domain-containing protein n=1 Tax=Albula glossodonta TaxID=121402 RepID=A0A8T2PFP6_9TELE|nr:hypothetical protein JZ751_005178 [Albula glossodonta]